MNLAIACWNIGDHDGAGKAFEAVLAATPESVDALKGLAALAVEREKYDQALDYQGRLIEKGERTPELFYNTGPPLQNSDQLEDAARLYRAAIEERRVCADARLN